MNDHVRIEQSGAVLAITLARPERRNAITVAMYAALADALEQASTDQSIRVIVFRGEGQDFAAGNDLGDFLSALPRNNEEIPVWRFLRALVQCETPIVAAVQGNCVGIGTTMLLHCDLVIAEEDARFSMPFVDLGLVPEAASSLLFPRLSGRRRAAKYLLLAESFGVEEAIALGLVSHRADRGDLGRVVEAILGALIAKPAEALRQTQRLLRDNRHRETLERMKMEGETFAKRLASVKVKQGISEFFAKRGDKPPA
jgi:enoyl-CoA hydratase/carnithine racemase